MVGLVVTMMVVVVAAVGLLALVTRGTTDTSMAERGTVALFLAQEKAEEIKTLPWHDIHPEPEEEVPGFPGFRRQVFVTVDGAAGMRVIRVVVSYVAGGVRYEVDLTFERARM